MRILALQTFGFDDMGAAIKLQATRHVMVKLAVVMG